MKRTLYNKHKPNYNTYKKRHLKYESIDSFIDKETFETLILKPCFYCGFQPDGKNSFNSIDRINNSKGYTIDNIIPCCKHCNYTKDSLNPTIFLEWFENISKHYQKNKNQIKERLGG